MNWIHHYQLFLFDFDGLLVNTEELHYKAYLKMCADRGFELKWSHKTFMRYALYSASGINTAIYQELPGLFKQEPVWEVLYREKTKAYAFLLERDGTDLMPGALSLLQELQRAKIERCVVTHSQTDQVSFIRKLHPVLDTIPHWITREHYSKPKPSSECYEKAILEFNPSGGHVIGFEDSPKGLQALLGTNAEAVLLTDCLEHSEIERLSKESNRPFSHFPSFTSMEFRAYFVNKRAPD